ncbi:MAG: T9SS type A sorting domain-containing protein, partial [Bacteroidetes bacterium]|nr:T9SS type A sorting domain-containing protein [Bacteroidota bacterium]
GDVSGYTSCYDVKWDSNKNLYTQSYYGWTVDKWEYQGTLPTISVTGVQLTGSAGPDGYTLLQNYPNPFNPSTTIEFSVPASGFVSLRVVDLLGREIATLVNEQKPAGTYRATFDATGLPSGTYFYSLTAGSFSGVKKMVLVK